MTSTRQEALSLIRANAANYERFFGQLEDPGWLNELKDEGFFSQPPDREEKEDWVRFPTWAESQYLIRVADKAPELVAEIAKAIPETNNIRVHEDLLRIAAKLPGSSAISLADKETEFLTRYRGPALAIADASDSLILHLVEEEELQAAFRLLGVMLKVETNPESEASTRKKAVGLIDEWQYGRTLERVLPSMLKADPTRAFSFVCDRLEEVLRIGFTDETGYVSADVWRPAIEDHGQNLGHSLLDTLTDSVRDSSIELAESHQLDLALLILGKHEHQLFGRIALHLLRLHGSRDQIAKTLLDYAQGYPGEAWHEYSMLLRDRFLDLSSEQRQSVLEAVSKDPKPDTDVEVAERLLYWRYRRLSLIASHLEGDSRAQYERLREKFGDVSHETFTRYSRSWTGPTSPYSEAELKELEPADVVEILKSWDPPEGIEVPTPEGLGRTLEAVVAKDGPRYAENAELFRDLDATYVRSLLGGMSTALKEGGVELDWSPVLDLCEWVIEQPRSLSDFDRDLDQDPHWGWARKQVADLLSKGLSEGANEIALAKREQIWKLLEALSEDPDPLPERETYDEHSMDPATLAINTVRGEAIHAVFRYLLWLERRLGTDFNGCQSAPEVVDLLERHLDLEVDPSQAVRAAYGQWFVQVVRVDQKWAEHLAPVLFPVDPSQGDLFDAAWDAYVVFSNPYRDVLRVLKEAYGQAITRIPVTKRRGSFAGDPVEFLGDHLLFFVAFGDLDLTDDGLFIRYWHAADDEAKKHVINQVGWSLGHRAEPLDDAVVERLQDAWEWIASDTGQASYLAAFGSWLGAKFVDGQWLLEKAQEVLERGIHLDPDFVVFEALSHLVSNEPGRTVELIQLMAETDHEGWAIIGSEDEIRQTLATALGASGEASDKARAVIDFLGASGMTSFGALLES